MKEENTCKVGKLFLSCLCGKHKKDSTCEVYLRNHGKWTKEIQDMKTDELVKWLKKEKLPNLAKALSKVDKLTL